MVKIDVSDSSIVIEIRNIVFPSSSKRATQLSAAEDTLWYIASHANQLHFRRSVPVKKLILTENPALRDVAFFRSGTLHWEGKGWPSVSVRRSVRNPGTRGTGRLLGMTSGGGWNGGTCGAGRPSRPSFR
jgi:hypothetical protein